MRDVFAAAGVRDIAEEHVSSEMIHQTPEQYWEFMNDIAAPVVAGLATVDEITRERIHGEVIDLARQSLRDGAVQLRSTATIVCGTR